MRRLNPVFLLLERAVSLTARGIVAPAHDRTMRFAVTDSINLAAVQIHLEAGVHRQSDFNRTFSTEVIPMIMSYINVSSLWNNSPSWTHEL